MMMWKKETSERGRGGRVLFFFFSIGICARVAKGRISESPKMDYLVLSLPRSPRSLLARFL